MSLNHAKVLSTGPIGVALHLNVNVVFRVAAIALAKTDQ